MAQITSLLNGENINQDYQITALHKVLINPGIISGLQVTSGQVAVGEAFVECIRSNGEKIMVHFANTTPLNLDTSGNKKIFIEVKQENIDNGILNAEDGSNIGEIKSAANFPEKNFLPLASVVNGEVVDGRIFVSGKNLERKGFGSGKIITFDQNGNEIVKNRIIGTANENDVVVLRTPNGDEKNVNFGLFKSSLDSGFIKKNAGEDLTGTGAIPVIIMDNVSNILHQIINIPSSNGETKTKTGTTLDGNITVLAGGWRGGNNYYIVDSQIIIDLGKIRHINTITLELDSGQSYTEGILSYSQDNNSYINMPMGNVYVAYSNIITYHPNLQFRYLKIQKTNSNAIALKNLKFFETKDALNGVYLADSRQGFNGRIDGFIFENKTIGQAVDVNMLYQYKNIGGFNAVNNSKIYLGGRGIFTTTPNIYPIGVVTHNNLTVDTTLRNGEGVNILNFSYAPNSYQNTNKFYSLIEAIPGGTYKIFRNSYGSSNISQSYGKIFIEHSFDGKTWKKFYEKNFHNGSFNSEDGTLDLLSGYARAGIEYLHSTIRQDNYFSLKNIFIKQIVG